MFYFHLSFLRGSVGRPPPRTFPEFLFRQESLPLLTSSGALTSPFFKGLEKDQIQLLSEDLFMKRVANADCMPETLLRGAGPEPGGEPLSV